MYDGNVWGEWVLGMKIGFFNSKDYTMSDDYMMTKMFPTAAIGSVNASGFTGQSCLTKYPTSDVGSGFRA